MAKKLKIVITNVRKLHKDFVTYEEDGTPVANMEAIEKWREEHPRDAILGARFFDEELEAVVKEKIEKKKKAKAKPKDKDLKDKTEGGK